MDVFHKLELITQEINEKNTIGADNFCENITSILMIPEEYEANKETVQLYAPHMMETYLSIKPNTLDINTEDLDVILQAETYDFNHAIAVIISERISAETGNKKNIYIQKFIRKFLQILVRNEIPDDDIVSISELLLELQLS